MAVLPTGIGPVTGGYQIERSLRFNSADSAGLNRTAGTQTSNSAWTYSVWLKRGLISTAANLYVMRAQNPGNTLSTELFVATNDIIFFREYGPSAYTSYLQTTQVFRDPSAWYHIVLAYNPANSTPSDKVRLYINGVRVTAFLTTIYPSSTSQATAWNTSGNPQYIGSTNTNTFDGYMTEINFIDGQGNLTQNDFGETDSNTGVWKPKKYGGTYGNNGFFLKFADNSNTTAATLGKDSSGNGNNWTPNLFSVTAGVGNDSLVDTPTSYGTDTGAGGEVRGNYATLNPLNTYSSITLSNGNLQLALTEAAYRKSVATMAFPSSGLYYLEGTVSGGIDYVSFGIVTPTAPLSDAVGQTATGYGAITGTTQWDKKNNGSTSGNFWAISTSNPTLQIAYNATSGKLWLGYNNTWLDSSGGVTGNPSAGTNETFTVDTTRTYLPSFGGYKSNSIVININFGQRAFAYTAPSGFKALCTQNLTTPTIGATSTTQANDYMNVVTYTGNGTTTGNTQSITGVNFQPDFTWIKSRSAGTQWHLLNDAIRGTNKLLYSNDSAAEASVTNVFNSFNADGFTVAYNSAYTSAQSNANGSTYVAWNWKANGAGVTNTAGSISSTVSANTTSGFSIVTYTGTGANATVGHGCQVSGVATAPAFIIIKKRNNTGSTYNWWCWHSAFVTAGGNDFIVLNLTSAKGSGGPVNSWNNTVPSSTVISLGSYVQNNNSGDTFVAYCFAPVAGYSAFGSYTGNGAADGPFVYTGFRPRYILIRNTGTSNWVVLDTATSPINVAGAFLNPNTSGTEVPFSSLDIVSNGFKLRNTDSGFNTNTATYIYAAFAESPFKYSLAR